MQDFAITTIKRHGCGKCHFRLFIYIKRVIRISDSETMTLLKDMHPEFSVVDVIV